MVKWLHNGSDVPNEIIIDGNTTTLVIANPQPSDAGIYHCMFNDTVGMWTLKRKLCKD